MKKRIVSLAKSYFLVLQLQLHIIVRIVQITQLVLESVDL